MEDVFWIVFVAIYLVVMALYGLVLLIVLIWQWLLVTGVLVFLGYVMFIGWQDSEARRRVEHRRRLAAIEQVRREAVATMIDIAAKNRKSS